MMILSDYNKEENIIYLKRIGDIELQDILNNIKQIDEHFQSLSSLYILEDVRESITRFSERDYHVIIEELKSRTSRFKEIRSAVLVEKPGNTALSILYELCSSKIENYKYRTFSTKKAAVCWLKKYSPD